MGDAETLIMAERLPPKAAPRRGSALASEVVAAAAAGLGAGPWRLSRVWWSADPPQTAWNERAVAHGEIWLVFFRVALREVG